MLQTVPSRSASAALGRKERLTARWKLRGSKTPVAPGAAMATGAAGGHLTAGQPLEGAAQRRTLQPPSHTLTQGVRQEASGSRQVSWAEALFSATLRKA